MQVSVFYGDIIYILPWDKNARFFNKPNKQIIVNINPAIKKG